MKKNTKPIGRPLKEDGFTELITFRIDASLKSELQKIAKSQRRSLSNYLLTIVEEKINSEIK